MLLTYVDESYCRDCYYVVALICPEGKIIPLTAALDGIVDLAVNRYGVRPETELHGQDLFVDTLHFTPSSASRMLQAVDLVAFLYHRILRTSPTADKRAVRANKALWGRIEPAVAHCHCWYP